MRTVRGARLLITGAASGMGALYAQRAVVEGAVAVALWDRDEHGLERVRKQLLSAGASTRVSIHHVDLGNAESIDAACESTRDAIETPDIIINNAGIVTGNAYFWETDMDAQNEPTLAVNVLAPMRITRFFLPAMIEDSVRPKMILNIASAAAMVSNPRMSVYASSKWAMLGWSDSVRLELQQAGIRHISVTTFCPSYVSTGMFQGARGMLLTPIITPERAVHTAWSAMLAGKPIQLAPSAVHLAKVLKGVLPTRIWDGVARLMGVYRSMDQFTGRKPTK